LKNTSYFYLINGFYSLHSGSMRIDLVRTIASYMFRILALVILEHLLFNAIPFYPSFVSVILIILSILLSIKSPMAATAFVVLIGVPAALYQDVTLGICYALFALASLAFIRNWIGVLILYVSLSLALLYPHLDMLSIALIVAGSTMVQPLSALFLGMMYGLGATFIGLWTRSSFGSYQVISMIVLPSGTPIVGGFKPPVASLDDLSKAIPNVGMAELLSSFGIIGDTLVFLAGRGCIVSIQIMTIMLTCYMVSYIARRLNSWLSGLFAGLIASGIIISTYLLISRMAFGYFPDPDFYVPFLITSASLSLTFSRLSIVSEALQLTSKAEVVASLDRLGIRSYKPSRKNKITFNDIGGLDDVKREIIETIVWPLRNRKVARKYGLKPPKGILLFGPPGCGKTLLMKALATHLNFKFFYVKCSDILSKWYGESEHKMAEIFRKARNEAPCILFFDELEALGRSRDSYSTDDVSPRLLSIMLAELDGLESSDGVLIVGATNMPQVLDKALIRPGRFDKLIYVPPPDKEARAEIFRIHTRNMPIAGDVDFDRLAELTERFSGADIAIVCQEAAREAVRYALEYGKERPVCMSDFIKVIRRYKPSITLEMMREYERFKLEYERRRFKPRKQAKLSWHDVIGLDEAKKILIESIKIPLKYPELLEKYGISNVVRGILLFGPPGCGKTLLARVAAEKLKVPFIEVRCSDISGRDAVKELKDAFNRAYENSPSVIFLDEIDAIAPRRDLTDDEVYRRVVAQLLYEMDGIVDKRNVVVLAATNRPLALDPALLRPGRFDKLIYVPPPGTEAREKLFRKHLEGLPLAEDVDFKKLAELTRGYSGADIVAICKEAKMAVIRRKIKGEDVKVTMKDIAEIVSRIKPSITEDTLMESLEFIRKYGVRI